MAKKRGRGWHGEPGRHRKAALGIKTVVKRSIWEMSPVDTRWLERQTAVLFKLWHGDGPEDAHTQLDWMTPRELVWILDKSPDVADYNRFDANELAKALFNTQGIKEVKFGRDYSPVLYIRAKRRKLNSVFNNFRRHMHVDNRPDEWNFDDREEFGEGVIRAWWD